MLEISNLQVSVEDKEILRGVSLSVQPGEIHAIMGPNGSGKSTLANTLAGHPKYTITDGEITLDNEKLNDKTPDQRSQAGLFLAFQYPVEVAGVSVQNFLRVAYEAKFGKLTSVLEFRKKLQQQAEELGIKPELLSRNLNENFSGGEKKRVEVLQMAVLQPKYAILDETDSGLDVDAIQAVSRGVDLIRQRGKVGILVITHYQRILEYLKPDMVHLLVKGKIVESGSGNMAEKIEKKGYSQYLQ